MAAFIDLSLQWPRLDATHRGMAFNFALSEGMHENSSQIHVGHLALGCQQVDCGDRGLNPEL